MDLVIIGAGGHGRDCHQLLDDLHDDGSATHLNLIGYVDDNPELVGAEVQGLPVLGGLDWLAGRSVAAVMGIGYPKPRHAVQQRASALGVTEWPTLVHPRAYIAKRARLERGVHVAPMAHVGPNVHISAWSIVNAGSVVGHDSTLGDHVLVAGNVTIAGGGRIGEGCLLGCGSTLQPAVNVGAWSVVGMGAVVTHDVPDGVMALGVPARLHPLPTTAALNLTPPRASA